MRHSAHACAMIAAMIVVPAAATAIAAPRAPREACFVRDNVEGFSAPDDRTVYLSTSTRDVYRLDLMTECTGLTFRQTFGLEDSPASPWICSPLEATVIVKDAGIRQRCPVSSIHKLTAAELAALPKRDRP